MYLCIYLNLAMLAPKGKFTFASRSAKASRWWTQSKEHYCPTAEPAFPQCSRPVYTFLFSKVTP